MNAVRLARAFTGRRRIAKFEGAYHGTHDWVMVSVTGDAKGTGSRRRPKAVAWSAGLPPPSQARRGAALERRGRGAEILEEEAAQLACLIVDPMMCNAGLLPPAEGFLARLREITERHGIVPDLRRGHLLPHRVGRRAGAIRRPARPSRPSAESSAAACRRGLRRAA